VKSAKQQSNYDKQRKQMRGEMQEYLLTYMVQCHALIMTEYARIFCYYYFWRTFSFHSNTVTLYLMISCEGELRNGKKYAELAYILPVSGNSGVQKRMAYQVPPG
jgi:hypothetical protein